MMKSPNIWNDRTKLNWVKFFKKFHYVLERIVIFDAQFLVAKSFGKFTELLTPVEVATFKKVHNKRFACFYPTKSTNSQ
jgi:hypothetical protein